MHHIFFPPRLEIVVKQQNPDGFSTHSWYQFTFHGLFGYQSHGPTRLALWRIAAYHGDDALFLVAVQHLDRAGSLLLVQSTIQSALFITMAEPPDCLGGQWDDLGNLRSAGVLSQLQQRQGSEDDSHLLHPAFNQIPQFLLVFLTDVNTQSWTTHTQSMRQINPT
jgi:hypothetical protein